MSETEATSNRTNLRASSNSPPSAECNPRASSHSPQSHASELSHTIPAKAPPSPPAASISSPPKAPPNSVLPRPRLSGAAPQNKSQSTRQSGLDSHHRAKSTRLSGPQVQMQYQYDQWNQWYYAYSNDVRTKWWQWHEWWHRAYQYDDAVRSTNWKQDIHPISSSYSGYIPGAPGSSSDPPYQPGPHFTVSKSTPKLPSDNAIPPVPPNFSKKLSLPPKAPPRGFTSDTPKILATKRAILQSRSPKRSTLQRTHSPKRPASAPSPHSPKRSQRCHSPKRPATSSAHSPERSQQGSHIPPSVYRVPTGPPPISHHWIHTSA